MKFKFAFDKLMRHRKMEEGIAQRDFLAAQALHRLEEQRLEKLRTELHRGYEERLRIAARGGAISGELVTYEEFLKGHKVRIERQIRVVDNFRRIAEQKQLLLVEAVKAFKVLEKLKERRFAAFKKERNRQETKEIDEMVTMRFQKGSAV